MADLKNANTGYPTAVDTYTPYANSTDEVTANVVNRILSAIVAVEGELGVSPSGSQSTLLDRLAVCLGSNGGLNSGTSFPLSPVDGQLFRRTDYTPPKVYQYQSSGASWALISSDASTLGGISASTTPTASTIPVSDGSNKLALGWLPTSVTGAQDKVPTQSSGTTLSNTWLPAGSLVQIKSITRADVVTCSTYIPADDTIPQNTEGTEVFSLSITASAAGNYIVVLWNICGGINTNGAGYTTVSALFRDSVANALTASYGGQANNSMPTSGVYIETAADTSAHTYKIRCGAQSTAIFYANGAIAGTRVYGGVANSYMVILEVKV